MGVMCPCCQSHSQAVQILQANSQGCCNSGNSRKFFLGGDSGIECFSFKGWEDTQCRSRQARKPLLQSPSFAKQGPPFRHSCAQPCPGEHCPLQDTPHTLPALQTSHTNPGLHHTSVSTSQGTHSTTVKTSGDALKTK